MALIAVPMGMPTTMASTHCAQDAASGTRKPRTTESMSIAVSAPITADASIVQKNSSRFRRHQSESSFGTARLPLPSGFQRPATMQPHCARRPIMNSMTPPPLSVESAHGCTVATSGRTAASAMEEAPSASPMHVRIACSVAPVIWNFRTASRSPGVSVTIARDKSRVVEQVAARGGVCRL